MGAARAGLFSELPSTKLPWVWAVETGVWRGQGLAQGQAAGEPPSPARAQVGALWLHASGRRNGKWARNRPHQAGLLLAVRTAPGSYPVRLDLVPGWQSLPPSLRLPRDVGRGHGLGSLPVSLAPVVDPSLV